MNERIENVLNAANLNWTVRQENVVTESNLPIIGHTAIVRDDNNDVLSVMSDGYYPYQNHELIELLDKVSNQTGLEVVKGGDFKGGRRVYVQLKSADLRLGNDKIEGYLTGINSFDGSTSLAFGPSNITISCMNTFFKVYANKTMQKVRHTKSLTIKIDEICRQLDVVLEQEQETYYTKKFYARRSQFFFSKPVIEARFNSSLKDKRNNFYASSSLADAEDNLNTLF